MKLEIVSIPSGGVRLAALIYVPETVVLGPNPTASLLLNCAARVQPSFEVGVRFEVKQRKTKFVKNSMVAGSR